MRATIIGPVYPFRGGIAHYTAMLAKSFIDQDHEIQVVSFRRQYPGWLYPGKSDKDPSEYPVKVDAEYILDPLYPWTWRSAVRRIQGFRPDLIIVQWWTTFWAISYSIINNSLRKRGMHVAYLIHNVLPHEERIWDSCLAHQALKQGDHFIVQTKYERERLDKLIPGSKATVFPLPNFRMFSEKRISKNEARNKLGLPQNKPVILFFGIIRPYKGLSYLLEALALLRNMEKEIILVVAGEFWEEKTGYIKQIEALQLVNQVWLYDHYIPNEEVSYYFSAADIFVAPYIGGTQSGAVSVALGSSLPVIVTENIAAGIFEANECENLYVIPSKDAFALSKTIDELLEQPNRLRASSQSQRDRWKELVHVIENICLEQIES
jgi:glycosyltransferase involved in cell wall biosynthesis